MRPNRVTVLLIAAGSLILPGIRSSHAATADSLPRAGYVSILLEPDLQSSFLPETSHMPLLERFFAAEAEQMAIALGEALGNTVFHQPLQIVSGNSFQDHTAIRSQGIPDSFLLTVDLVPRFGLKGDGALGTIATIGSFFLLSGVDLFTYSGRLDATVRAFFISATGSRIPLLEKRYRFEASVRGDFLQAMDLRQEAEWITDLTAAVRESAQRTLQAELPGELLDRAWSKVGGLLRGVPSVAIYSPPRGLQSVVAAAAPAGSDPSSLRKPAGTEDLVRRAARSVCRIETGQGTASGFVVSARGFIVTDLQAVGDSRTASIQFHNGEILQADVLVADRQLSLAVLAAPPGNYEPLPLASRWAENESLTLFGFPSADGLAVVSGRLVAASQEQARLEGSRQIPLETRGGPVLNGGGEVVGVNFPLQANQARVLPIQMAAAAFRHFVPPAGDAIASRSPEATVAAVALAR